LVPRVRTALMARPDPKVRQDQQVQLAATELTARSDRKVQWDQRVQRERPGLTAQSDRRARRDPSVLPALLALPVPSVPPALPDRTT
jgi:hypothetical protein